MMQKNSHTPDFFSRDSRQSTFILCTGNTHTANFHAKIFYRATSANLICISSWLEQWTTKSPCWTYPSSPASTMTSRTMFLKNWHRNLEQRWMAWDSRTLQIMALIWKRFIFIAYILIYCIPSNSISCFFQIDHIHKLSHEFYSLPTATKQKYRKTDPPECFHGYAGPGDEL